MYGPVSGRAHTLPPTVRLWPSSEPCEVGLLVLRDAVRIQGLQAMLQA